MHYCIHGKFRHEKITPPALKVYQANFLSCVNDCIEDMATMTALAKYLFMHQNIKGSWAWQNRKFPRTQYIIHPVFKKVTCLEFKH